MWLIIFSKNDVAEDERGERHEAEHDERLDRERRSPSDLSPSMRRQRRHRSMSPRMK